MSDIYNFSAGPAILPKEVLRQAQEELLDYEGSGMSIIESSHRGAEYSDRLSMIIFDRAIPKVTREPETKVVERDRVRVI